MRHIGTVIPRSLPAATIIVVGAGTMSSAVVLGTYSLLQGLLWLGEFMHL